MTSKISFSFKVLDTYEPSVISLRDVKISKVVLSHKCDFK